MNFTWLDYAVLVAYVALYVGIGVFTSRGNGAVGARSYFLAGRSLRWWSVGVSLIATNMTAAIVISMAGSGFAMGLAVATYEWLAAISLLLVGKFILPVYLSRRIYTLPQFLEWRFGLSLSVLISVIWLFFYLLIGLVPILWLAASVMHVMLGLTTMQGMITLALVALVYSLYGGLRSIATVDLLQVFMFVLGGCLIAWIALNAVGDGAGVLAGATRLMHGTPGHFVLILPPDDPNWKYLPGTSVLFGGIWILLISYWGFNQVVIQRALAAENLREAQAGVAFAACLKLFTPVLVILPGVAARELFPELSPADQAYPAMMGLAPAGLRGLIFAALFGTAISALGALLNSMGTLFALNVYRPMRRNASSIRLIQVGRLSAVASLLLALAIAEPLLGGANQVFQYIQIVGSYLAPGFTVLFLSGMYWERTSVSGAFTAILSSLILSLLYAMLVPEMPFLDRIGFVFLYCLGFSVAASLLWPTPPPDVSVPPHAEHTVPPGEALDETRFGETATVFPPQGSTDSSVVHAPRMDFSTSTTYNRVSLLIVLVVIALYGLLWQGIP